MTETVTRWWLVRHAPVIGVNGRVYGQDDIDSDCGDEAEFKHLAGDDDLSLAFRRTFNQCPHHRH